MRTSKDQPRRGKGGSDSGSSRGSSSGTVTGSTLGKVLGGLSSQMGLADLSRWGADRAERQAAADAKAAGKTDAQARGAARHARAAAIRETAKRAGVKVGTVRRWMSGAQRPAAQTERAARPKEQRSLGGARAIRAERMANTSRVNVGRVTVEITSGRTTRPETRNIPTVHLDESTRAYLADLIASGDDDAAAEVLNDTILESYGDGLSDFMTITEIPDPTQWL